MKPDHLLLISQSLAFNSASIINGIKLSHFIVGNAGFVVTSAFGNYGAAGGGNLFGGFSMRWRGKGRAVENRFSADETKRFVEKFVAS
ncbi:hypothetical protein Trydic_g2324 [Trypoxylus dichotomus]